MADRSRVATHLWFRGEAKEAAEFYVSILPEARIIDSFTFHNSGPDGKSSFTSVTFEFGGQVYMGLDGSPFPFNPATSIFIACDTQEEIDRLWAALVQDGQPQRCGWLTDRFGLCWQIAPRELAVMLRDEGEGGQRAMKAMLSMVKFDIAALRAAYEGI